jgi:GNAT superfamily N-acetyltransferase
MKIIEYTDEYKYDMFLCYLLAKEALGKPHLRDDLLDIQSNYFDLGDKFWLAISEDNRVIGMIGEHRISESEVFLKRLFIKPDYKRKGIGKAMLATVEEYAQLQGIHQIHTRFPDHYVEAAKFYPMQGFVETSRSEGQRHFVKEL